MPTAVPELIAVEIVTRLEAITVANGYAFNVAEVVRPSRKGHNWDRAHLGVGVLQSDSERVPELDCPGNPPALCYRVTFNLECVCKDSEIDSPTAAHATNENEMAATVIKALTVGGNTWHTMDGNAIDTEIGTHQPFTSSEGEMNGVMIPIAVLYRVDENNPYNVRG